MRLNTVVIMGSRVRRRIWQDLLGLTRIYNGRLASYRKYSQKLEEFFAGQWALRIWKSVFIIYFTMRSANS